jgi:CRP-like cAMP-binding protein
MGKLLLLFRSLRIMRMVNLNEDLGNFSAALFDVIPTLAETFVFTFIVTYIFGNMANLFFGKYIEDWSTPLLAVIKAQQLTFMVGFLDSAEQAMELVHPLTMLWFVFYLILSLTVANIALAIIINLHQTVLDAKSNGDREGMKSRIDAVFQKCVAQARSRTMFTSASRALNFKNLSMSHFQSSNTRQFVGGAKKAGFTMDDIKACVKYSSIDMIQNFKENNRNHKDLNWEIDFLKAVGDIPEIKQVQFAHGEVIFKNGEPATKLYLLIGSGSVLLKGVDSEQSAFCFIQSTNFCGVEALRPGAKYTTSCVAEKEATVLVFNQDDIAHKLEEELSGRIVRMAYKSHALQQKMFEESKQRADSLSAYRRRTDMSSASSAVRRRSVLMMTRTGSERSVQSSDGRSEDGSIGNAAGVGVSSTANSPEVTASQGYKTKVA